MKAVIYARYSSDNQREESIEGQLRECKAFADKSDMIILDTYIDRALSAKTDNRPEFQQMIKDSAKNLFDVVIVWKLDRFARNRYDSARYKATLKKNGVKVISAMETISDGPEGIILESMLEGYAEYYSAELSQKVIRGMTENALKAKYNGGSLTFGYTIDKDRHFQPDAETAPIVKNIFERYVNGESTKSILNSMLIQGFKNKGKKPTYSFITNMLKNRRYLGEYRFKDTVVENAFEPLVTKEIFDKCQRRLAANKRKSAHFKKVDDTYLLTGKIFCGHCGSSMSGVSGTSHTGDVHRYYHCRKAKLKKSCNKKRVSKEFIENLVFDCTMELLHNTPLINQIIDTCYEMQNKENSNIPIMQNQLKRVEKELANMMNAIKQGIITPSTKSALMELEQEKDELETKIAQEQIKRPVLSKEQIKCWIYRFRKFNKNNEIQKQQIINVFVNAIYVYDDKLLITFNYRDSEKCVEFDQVQKTMDKKKNTDNPKDYQCSPIKVSGEAADTDIISLIDGKSGVLYGVCTDAYDANYRTAEIPGFTLITGAAVAITFENGYEGTSASYLNINNTGTVAICREKGNAAGDNGWSDDETLLMIYDGTYWHIVGENMTYEPRWHSAGTNGRAGYSTKDEVYFDGFTSFEDGEGVYVPTLETSDSSAHAASTEFVYNVVDTEAEAREAADTELQEDIAAEASVREAADTELQEDIAAEASVREAADNAIYKKSPFLTDYIIFTDSGFEGRNMVNMSEGEEFTLFNYARNDNGNFISLDSIYVNDEVCYKLSQAMKPATYYKCVITSKVDVSIDGHDGYMTVTETTAEEVFKEILDKITARISFAEVCAALPDAAENLRGKVILLETTSGDRVYMCVKNASGEYEWKDISGGTDIVTQSETVATN